MSKLFSKHGLIQENHTPSISKSRHTEFKQSFNQSEMQILLRSFGNQALQRIIQGQVKNTSQEPIIRKSTIPNNNRTQDQACQSEIAQQTKIDNSDSDGKYKVDRITKRIMRFPNYLEDKLIIPTLPNTICHMKHYSEQPASEEKLESKQKNANSNHLASNVHDALHSSGTLPPTELRSFFEPSFCWDFGQVRMHTGAKASKPLRLMNSQSYAGSRDVAFGEGTDVPETSREKRFIAHELTHVIHQSSSDACIQRKDTSPQPQQGKEAEEKQETSIGVGSPLWILPELEKLLWNLPSRWIEAYKVSKAKNINLLFDTRLGHDVVYKQLMAGFNLLHTWAISEISKYNPDFSKSLEIAEKLSGVSDTYLNLASFALRMDLDKYLKGEFSDKVKENLLWAILYGLILQGGLVGLNAAMEEELNFTSIIAPATKKFTERPRGFGRSLLLENKPDERWGYRFWKEPSKLEIKLGGIFEEEKHNTFKLDVGFNIASMAQLLPEKEEDLKKYNGLELFPYFSLSHSYAKTGLEGPFEPAGPTPPKGYLPPEVGTTFLAGLFFGNKGYYTFLEGGAALSPGNNVLESYFRSGLFFRDKGPFSIINVTGETSHRPGASDSKLRARINTATSINILDMKSWELTLAGQMGYLLPTTKHPGALDFSTRLALYHKYYKGGETKPFKTGFDVSTMYRPQDPFEEASSRLFSVKGGFSLLGLINFSLEYHNIKGTGLDPSLPTNDIRFMIYPGPGALRW